MFGIDDPGRQKALIFGLLIVGGGALFYQYLWAPLHAEKSLAEEQLARLEQGNESARAVTQPRRVSELRQREAEYEVALAAYETMLPAAAEVPALLEEISAAALADEVEIISFAPLEEVRGSELVEFRYDLQIQGGYHDVGRFLSDIVNLPRLVRPTIVSLEAVEVAPATETLDAEYEVLASFVLSTFMPSDEATVVEEARTAGREPAPAASQARLGKRGGDAG